MNKSMTIAASSLVALSLLGAACGKDDTEKKAPATTTTVATTSDTEATATGVQVTDAWCRKSAAMAEAGGCYMTIVNGGSTADSLISVAVEPTVAMKAEIHETVADDGSEHGSGMGTDTTMAAENGSMSDQAEGTATTMANSGMMKMQAVEKLEIPAGETVKLEPGGYHVMLMGLAAELKEGETVKIALEFESSGTVMVDAEVRSS